MKKIVIILLNLIVLVPVFKAQNYTVNGTNDTIDVNVIWAYDTVFMDASLYVLDDVTLTINPGTVIMFNDFYKIKVEGTLLSQGTENDTIIYTVADTTGYYNFTHVGWDGIEFDADANMEDNDTTRFSYCAFYYGKVMYSFPGGGVFRIRNYSKIKIENSLFAYNYSVDLGGAIGIADDSEPIISNCKFISNNADNGGGAINVSCSDKKIDDSNQPVIKNCYFSGNKTHYSGSSFGGGAVKLSGSTKALVVNNIFEDNNSLSQGGALITSGFANPYVINNLFVNNTAEHNGGAIGIKYHAGGYFINNTIVNNYSGNYGGAVSIGCENDSVFFANNIIVGNTNIEDEYPQFYIDEDDEFMKFYNNDIEGGLENDSTQIIYVNNIDEDPLFVDDVAGNFKLQSTSPCVNTGKDTTDYITEYDLSGTQRIVDNVIDMGAYEYNPYVYVNDVFNNIFVIYPNPAKDFIRIELLSSESGYAEIKNISGQLIYSAPIVNNDLINFNNMAEGVYFITVTSGKSKLTKKIIVQ